MTENMRKWLELISRDGELENKVASIGDLNASQSREKITELAARNGISLSLQDFEDDGENSSSLSDEDLDSVTGGTVNLFRQYCSCGCITTGFGDDNLL